MVGAHATYWARRLLILILLGVTVTGCASFGNSDLYWGSRFGFRPDDPRFAVVKPGELSCDALNGYVKYAVNLKEAYRTRATQNRSWIYVAAITGLGVAAASGALAAATAVAAGTLAVLAISGGFTAGAFATIDNAELANVYTVAASDLGTALASTEARVSRCPFDEECRAQLAYLTSAVSNARNKLETARTSSAAGALARAAAQRTMLDQEMARVQAQGRATEAAAKGEIAAKDKLVADAAEREAALLGEKAKDAPADAKAQQAAGVARGRAEELRRQADRTARDADDAKAKLDEDAAARAAATGPVTPPCLRSPGRVTLEGRIVALRPDGTVTVAEKKAAFLDAVVEDVDLRYVPDEELGVEIGGATVAVIGKIQKRLGDPTTWLVRFAPPATRPKESESQYAPRLVYRNETLATAPAVRVIYQ